MLPMDIQTRQSDDLPRDELVIWPGEEPTLLGRATLRAAGKIAATLQNLFGNRSSDGFGILMYHRSSERFSGVEAPTINVTPQQFRRQLVGLLARGFECWPLTRLIEAHRESLAIPSNAFAITFDDGYENNYLHAWPILRELNLPGTIFVATKYLDTDRPFPFDSWSAAGSSRVPASAWRPLSTKQCEEMLGAGLIEIGAHTHSHERFLGRRAEFCIDMRLCLDVLRDRFGIERATFAFPYGDKNAELVEAARQLDVACSLNTRERRVRPGDDEYEWGRFFAGRNDTPSVLAAKLSGWYTTITKAGNAVTSPFPKLDIAATGDRESTARRNKYGRIASRERAIIGRVKTTGSID
jgi:peptidoglycan/xylan/chitin deacetylase (PgdA/CDA1 family)